MSRNTKNNKTGLVLSALAKAAKKAILQNKGNVLLDHTDLVNGKPERSYNQTEAVNALGFSNPKIRAICDTLGIQCSVNGSFFLEQSEMNRIHEYAQGNQWKRPDGSRVAVWGVSTQKGGAGKTTAATTIATGLGTEFLGKYRIGFVDLDPQGTATVCLKPNFNDADISVGDLLNDTYEYEEGESFDDVCRRSFYPTNIPGVSVLGGRNEDRYYETLVEERRQKANKDNTHYVSYHDLQRIIDAVEDDFDIIFIDTTPYFSAATNAGHFVANNLIIPIRPSENDFDGGAHHLEHLARQYQLFEAEGHTGYKNITLLPMAVEVNNAHTDMIHRTRMAFREYCCPYNFVESKAITHCASVYSTIYDISRSEYDLGSKTSLKRVQEETRPILRYIEEKTLQFWEE